MRVTTKITLLSFVLYCSSTVTLYAKQHAEYPSWLVYFGDKNTNYKHYKVPADISKEGCLWGSWVTFAQKIEAIQIKVRDISNPANLFYSKDFMAMYKHPLYYKQAILEYLADKNHSLDQKAIANAVSHTDIYKSAFDLYKKKRIDLETLALVFTINFVNLVIYSEIKFNPGPDARPFIQRAIRQIPKDSVLHKDLETLLSGKFPKNWKSYLLCKEDVLDRANLDLKVYQQDILPFYDVILNAVKDKKYYDCWRGPKWRHGPLGVENPPYFLMVLEHPQYYYPNDLPSHPSIIYLDSDGKKRRDGVTILKDPNYTDPEKSLTIFGMSQMGLFDPCESSKYYAWFIDQACQWYQQGALTDKHLSQLFVCDVDAFYKYPFFILDYKDKSIQQALDKVINLPTLPCGVKAIAQKIKEGTLASKEEMAYMEGYRTFRKSHFTLYETVPSCK